METGTRRHAYLSHDQLPPGVVHGTGRMEWSRAFQRSGRLQGCIGRTPPPQD